MQQGHWLGGMFGATSLAMVMRRTAGRLGDGNGPGTWGAFFPRPRPVLFGEAQVLQVGIGHAGNQGVPVQACAGAALEVAQPQLALELPVRLFAHPARLYCGGKGAHGRAGGKLPR